MQQQAQQGTANLQTPGQYNTAMDVTGMGIMNAANLGSQANPQNFQQQVGGYMNPYMQQVLQPQMDELRRQYDISGTQQAGQATQAGAFGGSRDAIMAAENQRNLGTAQNQAIGQAYGNAFNQAQNQYNQGQGMQLQANQAAMQNASQLAGLGQQQLTAQQGILGLQNQMGAQQQAYNQQVINQGMQDYANAQQYPLMQLGTMSNMLRGLPMQATTTNQYVAAPNPITQGIGAAGAAASLYNATKAEGGVIKSMASGGIASYDVGGEVYSDLEKMDPKELQQIAQHSDSPSMQKMARAILSRSAPVQAASGGIMHFADGDKVSAADAEKYKAQTDAYVEGAKALATDRAENPDTSINTDTEARFSSTLPQNVSPLTRAGQAIGRGITAVGKTLGSTPRQSMQFEPIDQSLIPTSATTTPTTPTAPAATTAEPAGITQVSAKNEAGKAALAQLATTSDTGRGLPQNALTPAQFAAQVRADKDISKENQDKMIESYNNGYRQLKKETEADRASKPTTQQPGILGAATAGTLPNAAPRVTPNSLVSPELADLEARLRKTALEQEKEGARPVEEITKEIRDREGPNVGLENYRKEEMARRANLGDEARRQKDMRLAEFFSKWGTTPGSTLVAGMTALKSSIPDMINDRKEARKLERESDKVIYDLEQADRLEKRGQEDKAYSRKSDAAKRAEQINQTLAKLKESQTASQVQREGHEMDYKAKMAQVGATSANTAAINTDRIDRMRAQSYQGALSNLENIEKRHLKERDSDAYKNAQTMTAPYEGKDISKLAPETQAMIQANRKLIAETNKTHARQIQNAQADVDMYYKKLNPEGKATAASTEDNDPVKIRPPK
jgi:hypothetical protein